MFKSTLMLVGIILCALAYTHYFEPTADNTYVVKTTVIFEQYGNEMKMLQIPLYSPYATQWRGNDDKKIFTPDIVQHNGKMFAIAGLWVLFAAMTMLFRKSRLYIYSLLGLIIPVIIVAACFIDWQTPQNSEKIMGVALAVVLALLSMAGTAAVFGFHHLKFDKREALFNSDTTLRNTNVVIPWLHYTPLMAHAVLFSQAATMGVYGLLIDILIYLLSYNTMLIPIFTIVAAIAALVYNFLKYKNFIIANQKTGDIIPYLLSTLVSDKHALDQRVMELKAVACNFNLDDIEFYTHESSNVKVLQPFYFDRRVVLRLALPMSTESDSALAEKISNEIANYFSGTTLFFELAETLNLPTNISHFGSVSAKMASDGQTQNKLYGVVDYEVTRKFSDGSKTVNIERQATGAGVPSMLGGLLLGIPVALSYLVTAIVFACSFVFKAINIITLKHDRIIGHGKS